MIARPLTRTIYSFPFPETQRVREELQAADLSYLYTRAWESIASNRRTHKSFQDGHADLFVSQWREWIAKGGVNLNHPTNSFSDASAFPFGYVHHGASGAIKDLVAEALIRGNHIHHFRGDYEGFAQTALCLGAPHSAVRVHDRPKDAEDAWETLQGQVKDGDLFFITNPSSIDGHYWAPFHRWLAWMEVNHPGVQVIVDLTYVGCVTSTTPLNLGSFPNVEAVLHSMSKPFGMYYDRMGVCVARHPHRTMEAVHTWMHNEFSLLLGEAMMRRFHPTALPRKYAGLAAKAIEALKKSGDLPPSAAAPPVWLLAVASDPTGWEGSVNEWTRAENVMRFCLTPTLWALQ